MRFSSTLTLFIALAACYVSLHLYPLTFFVFKGTAVAAEQPGAAQEDQTITIASFNIQVFGKTKGLLSNVVYGGIRRPSFLV